MEQKILAACIASRDAYNTITSHTDEDSFSIEGKEVLALVEEFYNNDLNAASVDKDILISRVEGRFNNPKHVAKFKHILAGLPDDVSTENIRKDVIAFKRHDLGQRIAASLSINPDDAEALDLMDKYRGLSEEEDSSSEDIMRGVSFRELFEGKLDPSKLIPLSPPPLNAACDGGAMPGHHVLVYGQSDMGKSLMVIYMMAQWAKQGYKVLFLENEEPLEFTIARLGSCITGMTKQQIRENLDKAFDIAIEKGYNNIIMKNVNPGTPREIDALVRRYKPDILIYNQIRNMSIKGDNRVNQLERSATEMRRLAKQYNLLAVSVTQGADSADGKLVLDKGDVDSSNVGIPGQCDLMIGIGANAEYLNRGHRMITLAKNKLSPIQGVHFPVRFNTVLTRVEPV